MTGTSFGADRATLLRLYKSLVLPIIEYGAVICAGGSKTALKTIGTLQNSCIRIALDIMKTSPINALHTEAHIPLGMHRINYPAELSGRIVDFSTIRYPAG